MLIGLWNEKVLKKQLGLSGVSLSVASYTGLQRLIEMHETWERSAVKNPDYNSFLLSKKKKSCARARTDFNKWTVWHRGLAQWYSASQTGCDFTSFSSEQSCLSAPTSQSISSLLLEVFTNRPAPAAAKSLLAFDRCCCLEWETSSAGNGKILRLKQGTVVFWGSIAHYRSMWWALVWNVIQLWTEI